MEKLIEQLKEIRDFPRKLHKSYLESHGLLTIINEKVNNEFPIKDKIDIILLGEYKKCQRYF